MHAGDGVEAGATVQCVSEALRVAAAARRPQSAQGQRGRRALSRSRSQQGRHRRDQQRGLGVRRPLQRQRDRGDREHDQCGDLPNYERFGGGAQGGREARARIWSVVNARRRNVELNKPCAAYGAFQLLWGKHRGGRRERVRSRQLLRRDRRCRAGGWGRAPGEKHLLRARLGASDRGKGARRMDLRVGPR